MAVVEDRGDHWHVALGGWRVGRICVDYELRLLFPYAPTAFDEAPVLADPPYVIAIAAPFTFADRDGARALNPQGRRELLAPTLALFRRTITYVAASKSGALVLRFRRGVEINVEPDDYEAWTISGPDGLLIVSPAGGGEPAVWHN